MADDGGDIGQHAGAIFGENAQSDLESGSCLASPLDGDAAFGVIQEILHIGTAFAGNGDAAAARDVADEVIPRDPITKFRPISHQIIVAHHSHPPSVYTTTPLPRFL